MVAGGNPLQRPDQLVQGLSRAGVGPAPQSSVVIARIVVIYGAGVTGLFLYNGKPQAGNYPILYETPPGVTEDPYGNSLPITSGGLVSSTGSTLPVRAVQINGSIIDFWYSGAQWGSLQLEEDSGVPILALGATGGALIYIGSQSSNTHGLYMVPPSGDTTGATDTANINAAIGFLSAGNGGTVLLLPGVFYRNGPIIIDSDFIILEGQGSAATNILGTAASTGPAVIVGNTHALSGSGVKGLQVSDNGGGGVPVAGSTHGIVFAVDAGILEDVVVQCTAGDNFHIGQDLVAFALSTTVAGASVGAALPAATLNVVSTAGFNATGSLLVPTSDGAALCTYTGTSGGNQFTGCTWSFPGTGTTLVSTSPVTQPTFLTDLTAINCYAQKLNATTGRGWYIDYTYSSCEMVVCRSQGSESRPAATGSMTGWVIYGQDVKLVVCHAFFWNNLGLQLNDVNVFSGGALSVTGGEWENNAVGGARIYNPSENCWFNPGTQFYGNGIGTGQSDLTLSFGSGDVNVVGVTFKRGGTAGVLVAQNIYAQAVNHINITGCVFDYPFVPHAIEIDGSGAGNTCAYVFIRDCKFTLTDAASDAVLFNGGVFNSVVRGCYTDASLVEAVSTETPNDNQFYDNVLDPTYTPSLTLVGPDTMAWDNVGAGSYWHAVGLPAGWTGQARVRILPDAGIFDFAISIAANTSATATFGTFPDATFYPLNAYITELAQTGTLAGSGARVTVNTASTAPALASLPVAGTPAITISATLTFPLD